MFQTTYKNFKKNNEKPISAHRLKSLSALDKNPNKTYSRDFNKSLYGTKINT
jgi:hypothetical protein